MQKQVILASNLVSTQALDAVKYIWLLTRMTKFSVMILMIIRTTTTAISSERKMKKSMESDEEKIVLYQALTG